MKKIVQISGVVLLVTVAGGVILLVSGDNPSKPQNIHGVITAISTDCYNDGTCSVTVNSTKTIITGCGLRADGTTCKTYDVSRLQVGEEVDAIVVQDKPGLYDLECPSCTIRPVIP